MTSTADNLVMGIPSTMNDDYQLNLRKLFERGCRIQPNSEIVTKIDNGTHRMTYSHLQMRATRMASALNKSGIKPGDRVGTFCWNNARHMVLYYAVPAMGAVLHAINIRLHPKELGYLIEHANDKIIFIDANLLPIFEEIPIKCLKNVEKFVICGNNEKSGGWQSNLPRTIDFELFETHGSHSYIWPNLNDHSGMGLCYTSGTTGNPKGVLYSHRSTYLHTLTSIGTDIFGTSGTDCILPLVPMFHVLSWGFPFVCMALGCKLLLHNTLKDSKDMLDFMNDEKCTLMAGVPTVMQGIRTALENDNKLNIHKYDGLRGILTRAICGGSAPPAELINWFWNEWGIELIQAWGMTETNPLGTIGRRCVTRQDYYIQCKINELKKFKPNGYEKEISKLSNELTKNQQKIGLSACNIEAKVVNSDNFNEELGHTSKLESGDLLVYGPYITNKYFQLTEEEMKGKFYTINGERHLVTGDIAAFNEKEQLMIRDRSKDMIKTGGEWVSSVDMENKIMDLLNNIVEMACVVGVKHPKWDERPIVIVKLKNEYKDKYHNNNNNNERKELYMKILQKLGETYAKFQLPDDLLIWDEIPLTGTGKMSKKNVRSKLDDEKYVLPSLKTQSKL